MKAISFVGLERRNARRRGVGGREWSFLPPQQVVTFLRENQLITFLLLLTHQPHKKAPIVVVMSKNPADCDIPSSNILEAAFAKVRFRLLMGKSFVHPWRGCVTQILFGKG